VHLTDFNFFWKPSLKSKQFKKADKIYIFKLISHTAVEKFKKLYLKISNE